MLYSVSLFYEVQLEALEPKPYKLLLESLLPSAKRYTSMAVLKDSQNSSLARLSFVFTPPTLPLLHFPTALYYVWADL